MTVREEFRTLVESLAGASLPDEDLDAFARAVGVSIDDPQSWRRIRDSWEAIEPTLDPDDRSRPFFVVDPVFQAVIDAEPQVFDPAILADQTPAVRMLISTRAIDTQVDNGGWESVFYNEADGLLPLAIEGYRLLGLAERAALAAEVLAHGWTEPADDEDDRDDDPVLSALLAAWFALPDAEAARAKYILEHPDAFARR